MVSMFFRRRRIAVTALSKVDALDVTELSQNIEGAIHGRQAQVRILRPGALELITNDSKMSNSRFIKTRW